MTKDEALAKLQKARELLDEVDGILGEVAADCDEAGLDCSEGEAGDIVGIVRDNVGAWEGIAQGL